MTSTSRQPLTQARLKEVLHYDPETGCWTRLVAFHRRRLGPGAGSIFDSGYRYVRLDGKAYRSARLAWFYMHGEWPVGMMDHLNGDRDDDRLINLRVVSVRENTQNKRIHREGRLYGCSFHKPLQKWKAAIQVDKVVKHLGYFATEREAHECYLAAVASL